MSAGGDYELVVTVRPEGLEAARRADGDRRVGGGGDLNREGRQEETVEERITSAGLVEKNSAGISF
jgi:thiamine monophosphate kinase